jgi:ABC-type polysaccharide/polyol phosphate export permease
MRRVIGALLLRELFTRYGRNNIGFLWVFVEPMLVVAVMVGFRVLMKSAGYTLTIPIVAFALTGWTSMLLWRQMPSRCIGALKSSLSLLYHKPVTITDVFIARVILEFCAYTTVFVVLAIVSYAMGWVPAPEDALQMLWGWLLFGWFAVGLGWTVGGLSEKSATVEYVWRALSLILMFSSGVFFLAESIPPYLRDILLWLPMLNMVEYLREGWFGSLFNAHYDIFYVVCWNLVLTFSGLSLVRQVGTDLTEK